MTISSVTISSAALTVHRLVRRWHSTDRRDAGAYTDQLMGHTYAPDQVRRLAADLTLAAKRCSAEYERVYAEFSAAHHAAALAKDPERKTWQSDDPEWRAMLAEIPREYERVCAEDLAFLRARDPAYPGGLSSITYELLATPCGPEILP